MLQISLSLSSHLASPRVLDLYKSCLLLLTKLWALVRVQLRDKPAPEGPMPLVVPRARTCRVHTTLRQCFPHPIPTIFLPASPGLVAFPP